MLLHHTPRLENFHGLLSMSSYTICPCFCISSSFSQLTSSIGWFFHLNRYSKYCFRLVFLPARLSSIRSICGFSTTGNCFIHWINGCLSFPYSASPSLYGYKSETLNIRDIPMPSGNSISYAFSPNLFRTLQGPIFFILSLLYVPLGNLFQKLPSVVSHTQSEMDFCLYSRFTESLYANSAYGNMLSQLPWCSVTKLLSKSPRLLFTTSVCPSHLQMIC
jgi:hypothetical protein